MLFIVEVFGSCSCLADWPFNSEYGLAIMQPEQEEV